MSEHGVNFSSAPTRKAVHTTKFIRTGAQSESMLDYQ